jgi:hypothetical protein
MSVDAAHLPPLNAIERKSTLDPAAFREKERAACFSAQAVFWVGIDLLDPLTELRMNG